MDAESPLAVVRQALAHLPVVCVQASLGPAPVHVKGHGLLNGVDVYLHPEHAAHFAAGLRGALQAQSVWAAWLRCRDPQPLEWTEGYLAARRTALPQHGGVYQPLSGAALLASLSHPEAHLTAALRRGAAAYLRSPQLTQNAAD